MEKIILLREYVKDINNNELAILETYLRGDGSTPIIQAMGGIGSNIIGYKDNGEPIIDQNEDNLIEAAKVKLMAEAIKEQKKLCVENGVDPELVNIINAEKKVNNE
ncbi:hypothetical protein LMB41_02715 [Limosilactobacillus reuteri]|jgi:hypothetical protein|uniref:hypothetical protein n=1 Tax=Limosilactobacillus reuteri TaxID=1598 RepID=UPI000A1F48F2|nr:hypothetical protein [Limosilactobacillus reuteri]MCC4389124.1 hypothetical protein [Limosilactobacillus reuteri]